MSYLTDIARAASRAKQGEVTVPGQMFDEIVAANPARRTILKNSFGLSLLSVFGATSLAACGSDDDGPSDDNGGTPPTPPGPEVDYSVGFKPLDDLINADTVTVPEGYVAEVLYSAGDACVMGSVGYSGTPQAYPATETLSGGQHDGMFFFPLPGVDPNKGGLLAINHENLDGDLLDATGANAVKTELSNVGVSVIEVERGEDGKWSVKPSSYNKRYSGNTLYNVSGPAKSVIGNVVVGTLNNCASGETPWGTYLTCEETTDNYLDPTQNEIGYGWVVEIDPQNTLVAPTKRTALGRFAHENTAYMVDENNRVAIYMGDDGTPGCIYKFVPSKAYNPTDRAANAHLLDEGTLYVARFNDEGGVWVELTQGKSNLTVGASDPGNFTQLVPGEPIVPETIDFNSQADVLINTQAAARVAGGTLMDRPEWITVGPDKRVYCTLTNNSSRKRTSTANPRVDNAHGHIVRWTETGNSPLATTFDWELLLLAGDPSIPAENLKGNIKGDTFSSPDGICVDPKGRLWVQTDAGTGPGITSIFGANSMYYVNQETRESQRFLVGPVGCEITGLAYTPDLSTFFINVQHPNGSWNTGAGTAARSATVVVRRTDGKPVGA